MPDITMCKGADLPVCVECYRRTAKPSDFVQSYFVNPPADAEGCEYVMKRRSNEP